MTDKEMQRIEAGIFRELLHPPTHKPISSHKKNNLDKSNSYKLTRWIDINKEQLDKLTQFQIATMAEKTLGFSVTAANIYGASNALGIKLGMREIRSGMDKNTNRVIAKHLAYLYEKLGEPVPESLRAIAKQ